MGFSCTGGETERLVLLVPFFKGGKRANKGVQREAFFCDCFVLQIWCTAWFLGLQVYQMLLWIHPQKCNMSEEIKITLGICTWKCTDSYLESNTPGGQLWVREKHEQMLSHFSFDICFSQESGSKWCETKALEQDGNKDFRSHTQCEEEASRSSLIDFLSMY